MKTTNLIIQNFRESKITFTEQGWINATATCEAFGKNGLDNYLRSKRFIEYAQVVSENLKYVNFTDLKFTKKGHQGGTYLHPKLAVEFARWISPAFGFWCDETIETLLNQQQQAKASTQITSNMAKLEKRITSLEEDKHQAAQQLKALSEVDTFALFVDTRRALDRLIKDYATATQTPVKKIYNLLYKQFSVMYRKNIYQQAKKCKMSPIAWIESNGFITEAYDLAKQIFRIPSR
jgi:hypothetical protein